VIRLLVSNPMASRVETATAEWVVSGTNPANVVETLDGTASFDEVVEEVRSLPGEYSLVAIDADGEPSVRAYRGLTSSFDVFYAERPGGTLVVGDHFRDVLSRVPASDRTVGDAVGADQLLFGTRPNAHYVEEVDRLGHGEVLEWDPDGGGRVRFTGKLPTPERLDRAGARDELDAYLSAVVPDAAGDGSVATMLSGGVDSTLVQTYSRSDATVSGVLNSPKYDREVRYAERASDLLDTDHEFVAYDESEFVDLVRRAVDATGHPLVHLQTTIIERVFAETEYDTYLNGEFADSVYGRSNLHRYRIAWLLRHLAPYLPEVDYRISHLKEYSSRVSRRPTDPDGVGMNPSIHADEGVVADVVGRETVRRRKERRLEYTAERVDVLDERGFGPHMHLAHFISFFQANTASLWRHAAHAHGKSLQMPYTGTGALKAALSLPASKRYLHRLESKHLLKDLLSERVPAYDTSKSKLASNVDTSRYLQSGPLSDAFERYPVPEFVPDDRKERIRRGTGHESWYAFSYAVWRDRVLENDDLEVYDTTTVIER